MREKAKIFYNSSSALKDILEAGYTCTAMLFGLSKDTTVNKLKNIQNLSEYLEQMRYNSFINLTTKKKAVKLSSLVPTVGALNEHIKRVYLQVQIWLGNKNINPLDWGWLKIEGKLHPVNNPNPPAPEELLQMIFCSCKKGCGSACGCRRVGLFCNATCRGCSEDSCSNRAPILDEDENVNSESDDEQQNERREEEEDSDSE